MPYARPSLADLDARLRAAVESRLPGVDPALRRSLLGALTRAVAGAHHEMYGYLAWVAEQAMPDTAETAELARWAAIWGLTRSAAVAAAGRVRVRGTAGARIPSGTVWRRADGAEYRATAERVVDARGDATVAVTAAVPGVAGAAAADTAVTLVSPLAGVVAAATVVAITGGVDVESDESLRTRLLARLRATPRGGAAADYVVWAHEAAVSVTRAWARPNTPAPGHVTVYIMTDGGSPDGTPIHGETGAVAVYIADRRPVTATVTVAGPTAVPLAVTIRGITPDSPAVRAAVTAELADLIRRESEPGGTILVSHLREAISGAAGETDHVLVSPTSDVTHTASQIAVPGGVTWQ